MSADPSTSKVPIFESVAAVPDPRNATPSPTSSPSLSAIRPIVYPIHQGTVHRPPSSTAPSEDSSEPDDDYKTININITIKVPASFRFPCFHRCKRRDGQRGYRSMRDGIPVEEKKRRFIAIVLTVFYISFIVCGAVAWHIKNHFGVYTVPHAPLVIETFIPLLDFFVLLSTILFIRRHREGDKPTARYPILILINLGLFILHLVILIMAAHWAGSGRHTYYYYYNRSPDIGGLILYNTSTMILFKLLVLIAIIRNRSLRGKLGRGLKRIPEVIGEDYRYHSLAHDVDEDATGIDSARNSTEQHGRVFLA